MSFPQTILDLRADAQLSGVWTSITPYVYQRDQVTIKRGHPDESSRATPQTAAFAINNRDGRFSPRNPTGPYYGQFGRNTPLRLSLPEGSTYLRMEGDTTSYASCPDATRLHVTGDIEIQLDMQLSDWTCSVLASKYGAAGANNNAWTVTLNDDGTLRFFWSPTGSGSGSAANSTMPVPLGRIAVKVTLAVATGTVTFYTAPTIAGSWTQLGSTVASGATSIFASTAALVIGANSVLADSGGFNRSPRKGASGKVFAFKLLNGIGGTTVANPVFTSQAAGTTSFADAQTNTWTLNGTAEISDRKYRFHGEGVAWPQRWDVTGKDVWVPMQAAGILRRLQAPSTPPLSSPMYRAYTRITGTTAPVAYWPCEDGTSATQIASGLTGGNPMTLAGNPSFASDSSFACSNPLPQVNSSTWTGVIPSYTAPSGAANTLRFLMKVPSASQPADGTILASLFTFGTVARADVIWHTGGALQLKGYTSAGATVFDTGSVTFGAVDELLRVSVELNPSGGNIQYQILTLQPGAPAALVSGGTVAGSIGNATEVIVAPNGGIASAVIGHISVQPALDSLFNLGAALNAWIGEYAGNRFARLCSEEGLPYRVYGYPGDSVAMGAQATQTLLALLQECEDADRGLITEARQALALGYRTRVSMFNQAAAATLDYAAAHLSPDVLPTDDDQLTVNDVTVTRTGGGSSSRQVQTSGALSTQAPPAGVGPYPTAVSINLSADSQLPDEAGWILHMGTVDEPRYPTIPVNLARPALAALYSTLQDVDLGDRLLVNNPPAWLPPDAISQIVRGLTEVCYGYVFTIAWACAPESPYRVAIMDDPVFGRADTDGSTLAAGVTSIATSLSVASTDTTKPLWTTSAAEFPFDIVIAGERITVTNITGTSSPQTFTVTRSVNGVVKAQSSGADVRLFQPAILSM